MRYRLFHVDGVGCADGRLQFGAAGNAAGPWLSPPGDLWRYRNCSETTPGLIYPFPRTGVGTAPWPGMNCIGMQWIPMHWIPIHSIDAVHCIWNRYGYHWNGYLWIDRRWALALVLKARSRGAIRMLHGGGSAWIKPVSRCCKSGPSDGRQTTVIKASLAHARSARDNPKLSRIF